MTNKERLEELELCIYMQPWWLDIVTQGSWDVVLCEKGGTVQGVLVYCCKKKIYGQVITMPVLTKYNGIQLYYPTQQKNNKRYSFEHKTIRELLSKLPKVNSYVQTFSPSFTNHLAFYWEGYKQTTKYTYKLPTDKNDATTLWTGLAENIRREVKKAEKSLKINFDGTSEKVLGVNKELFARKKMEVPFDENTFITLVNESVKRGQGVVLSAEAQNNFVAAAWFVWDNKCVYYQGGGAIDEYVNSGAMSLLIWEGIKLAQQKGLEFDFEGSMLPSIERFFRGFGAVQTPYYSIQKESKLLQIVRLITGKE